MKHSSEVESNKVNDTLLAGCLMGMGIKILPVLNGGGRVVFAVEDYEGAMKRFMKNEPVPVRDIYQGLKTAKGMLYSLKENQPRKGEAGE
jgi:hypothetical protein